MNRDSDDSKSIHKCQKSIFYMTECKRRNSEVRKCSVRTVDSVHTTKNMGCVVNVCTCKELMGGTSEAFVNAERLESSVETAAC